MPAANSKSWRCLGAHTAFARGQPLSLRLLWIVGRPDETSDELRVLLGVSSMPNYAVSLGEVFLYAPGSESGAAVGSLHGRK